MPQNKFINQGFLPKTSIHLGRFLVDVSEPLVAYHDPGVEIKGEDLIISPHISYSEVQQIGSNDSFAASLTSLVSASFTKKVNTVTRVSSDRVTTYKLANAGAWFKKAVKEEQTRRWIEEQHDGGYDDVYIVVGYHTMLDANVVLGGDETKDISKQVQVPISAALAAGGVILPVGGITDPKFSAKHEESRGAKLLFVAPGERICAVQHRKIVYKWLSSRDLNRAVLGKENRWKSFSSLREATNKADNDVLEVELEEDTESKGDEEVFPSETEDGFLS
ncbi:hypothetical protein F5884DRAFT_686845 [Xylogone sp. PMI_703]|nr:hypothetical protein F5884DRAFT_686845 [Xylogone sp. PMI_703]